MKPSTLRYGLILIPLVLFLSGCGVHRGDYSSLHHTSEPERNYRILKSVTGKASTTSIFGIRSARWNLYDRARRNLLENANLKPNQRVINWTLDERMAGFPPTGGTETFIEPILGLVQIYSKKTVYLSGEVVKITGK